MQKEMIGMRGFLQREFGKYVQSEQPQSMRGTLSLFHTEYAARRVSCYTSASFLAEEPAARIMSAAIASSTVITTAAAVTER